MFKVSKDGRNRESQQRNNVTLVAFTRKALSTLATIVAVSGDYSASVNRA